MIGEASGRLVTTETKFSHSFELELAHIAPDPEQPRRVFNEVDLDGLAITMGEQGQLQPILVRRYPDNNKRWMIVAGERRWRAAMRLGWTHILAIEHTGDTEVTALIENLQRIDLSAIEEARGLQRLIQCKGWSQERVASALGKLKSEVSGVLRILSIPADLLDKVQTSELSIPKSVLMEIARIDDPARRDAVLSDALLHGMTVREVREVRSNKIDSMPVALKTGRDVAALAVRATAAVQRSVNLVRAVKIRPQELPADLLEQLGCLRDEIDLLLQRHDDVVQPSKIRLRAR